MPEYIVLVAKASRYRPVADVLYIDIYGVVVMLAEVVESPIENFVQSEEDTKLSSKSCIAFRVCGVFTFCKYSATVVIVFLLCHVSYLLFA
jgi:hypothetical protein